MLCRAVSNMAGLFPPSCPGIPDQPRCAGRDEEGGAGTQGLEVLQHQSTAQLPWSRSWVRAIHGHKVLRTRTHQVLNSLIQTVHFSWLEGQECQIPCQAARLFFNPTLAQLKNKLLPYLNFSTRAFTVIDTFYKGALLYTLLPAHASQIPQIRYPNTRTDWLTSMLTCH